MNQTLLQYHEIEDRVGGPVTAVVFGCGETQGLAALRALGRLGIPVCAVGKKGNVGFHSRYATECRIVPDSHADPEGVIRVVLEIGRQFKREGRRGVLLPTQDSMVELLCRDKALLQEFFICQLPEAEIIRDCSDKQVQYRLAKELGVPLPNTFFEAEYDRLLAEISSGKQGFPLIFKSRRELPPAIRKKFRLKVINDKEQLKQVLAEARAANVPYVVQEVIPGGDDSLYTLGSYMNRAGELKAWFTGRKLRQQPPLFGICRVGENIAVEQIVRDGERLLRALNFYGISQVEYKFDARDGQYKLIEVNPRAWAWIALPIAMGVNLPYAFFCDALGVDIPRQTMLSARGVYISLFDDFYWSLKARDGIPWAHCFKGYDLIVEPYYAPDDRKPGLVHFKRCAVLLLKMVFNAILRTLGLCR